MIDQAAFGTVIDYLLVALFGLLIGLSELLSRYRDAPFKASRGWQAMAYIGVNSLAAVMALWMLRLFDVTFGLASEPEKMRWVQVLAAGFGAMVLFRSALFVIRAGDQDVSVGPSSLLQIILDVLDREVDRQRAQQRAKAVKDLMKDISFVKAREPLPVVAFALMQNLPMEDQEKVINKALKLSQNRDVPEHAKTLALGLALIDAMGEDVLKVSIGLLETELKATALPADAPASVPADFGEIAMRELGEHISIVEAEEEAPPDDQVEEPQ